MLRHKISIYIPSTLAGHFPAPADVVEMWLTVAKLRMARCFGGFTATQAVGGYVSDLHGTIEEQVVIITSFTDSEGLSKVPEVESLARQIAAAMQQECVSVEVDGTLTFIEPERLAKAA